MLKLRENVDRPTITMIPYMQQKMAIKLRFQSSLKILGTQAMPGTLKGPIGKLRIMKDPDATINFFIINWRAKLHRTCPYVVYICVICS